jgi:hypothetical protein
VSTQRPITAKTAALGVDFVQNVVHRDNSIFHKIDQDNDVGNDAYIEFNEDTKTTGCCIAVQIKSGESYISGDGKTFHFKADKPHFEYWSNHSLPVCGVVYDPTTNVAVWCDITRYLHEHPYAISTGPYTISIPREQVFSTERFSDFKRHFLVYRGTYSSDTIFGRTLTAFADLNDERGCYGALRALFSFHRDRFATWYYLWGSLKNFRAHPLLPYVVAHLSYIPGHGDIFWHADNWVKPEVSQAVRAFIRTAIGRDEIITLLECVDENGFQRGSIGQGVWSLITVANRCIEILRSIVPDRRIVEEVRFSALWLLSFEMQGESPARALAVLAEFAPEFPDEMHREMLAGMATALRDGTGISLW